MLGSKKIVDWLKNFQHENTNKDSKEMETQTELCGTKNQHSQTVNESDVQDLEPNMNKDQWTDVISRNWDPSLFKTTEIKDGNLFSSHDAVFKVLLTDRSGEVSGMDKVPELRDIKEDYGILYKEHSN